MISLTSARLTSAYSSDANSPEPNSAASALACTSLSSGLPHARASAEWNWRSMSRNSARSCVVARRDAGDLGALGVGGPAAWPSRRSPARSPGAPRTAGSPAPCGRRRRSSPRAGARRPPTGCRGVRGSRRSPGPGSPRAPTCGRRRTPGTAPARPATACRARAARCGWRRRAAGGSRPTRCGARPGSKLATSLMRAPTSGVVRDLGVDVERFDDRLVLGLAPVLGRHQPHHLELQSVGVAGVQALVGAVVAGAHQRAGLAAGDRASPSARAASAPPTRCGTCRPCGDRPRWPRASPTLKKAMS